MYKYPYENHNKILKEFINHTDFEESEQHQLMSETGIAIKTRSVTETPVDPNGKCINLIYFHIDLLICISN